MFPPKRPDGTCRSCGFDKFEAVRGSKVEKGCLAADSCMGCATGGWLIALIAYPVMFWVVEPILAKRHVRCSRCRALNRKP